MALIRSASMCFSAHAQARIIRRGTSDDDLATDTAFIVARKRPH
jgi:hypothetical protein